MVSSELPGKYVYFSLIVEDYIIAGCVARQLILGAKVPTFQTAVFGSNPEHSDSHLCPADAHLIQVRVQKGGPVPPLGIEFQSSGF